MVHLRTLSATLLLFSTNGTVATKRRRVQQWVDQDVNGSGNTSSTPSAVSDSDEQEQVGANIGSNIGSHDGPNNGSNNGAACIAPLGSAYALINAPPGPADQAGVVYGDQGRAADSSSSAGAGAAALPSPARALPGDQGPTLALTDPDLRALLNSTLGEPARPLSVIQAELRELLIAHIRDQLLDPADLYCNKRCKSSQQD